jgi:alkanesulfonate monooxygenase SsuD/methylene tetrahydromethanopterin reductase-like flavin-dependent oxidoreductase (luciferase family)
MGSDGRGVEFGVFPDPSAEALGTTREVARVAEESGLDLIGVQDHPYQRRFLDTWTLMADLLARTERVRVFPDVANLPLRGPAMIAKQSASLDLMSGGRFELGLGAGAFWEAIGAMGGPVRTPPDALGALEEAIRIIRLAWSGERSISFEGEHYVVRGLHPGPPPAHTIGIWLGVYRPRALALAGRLADGWLPSLGYAPPEGVQEMGRRIDDAAAEADRDPRAIRRIYNVGGEITDGPARALLHGPAEHWVEELSRFAIDLGFDGFVLWPSADPIEQTERFAREVAPAVRDAVAGDA